MTEQEKIIVSGYTHILMVDFQTLHGDIERRLGRPVFTHDIPSLGEEIKTAYREDFLKLAEAKETNL